MPAGRSSAAPCRAGSTTPRPAASACLHVADLREVVEQPLPRLPRLVVRVPARRRSRAIRRPPEARAIARPRPAGDCARSAKSPSAARSCTAPDLRKRVGEVASTRARERPSSIHTRSHARALDPRARPERRTRERPPHRRAPAGRARARSGRARRPRWDARRAARRAKCCTGAARPPDRAAASPGHSTSSASARTSSLPRGEILDGDRRSSGPASASSCCLAHASAMRSSSRGVAPTARSTLPASVARRRGRDRHARPPAARRAAAAVAAKARGSPTSTIARPRHAGTPPAHRARCIGELREVDRRARRRAPDGSAPPIARTPRVRVRWRLRGVAPRAPALAARRPTRA